MTETAARALRQPTQHRLTPQENRSPGRMRHTESKVRGGERLNSTREHTGVLAIEYALDGAKAFGLGTNSDTARREQQADLFPCRALSLGAPSTCDTSLGVQIQRALRPTRSWRSNHSCPSSWLVPSRARVDVGHPSFCRPFSCSLLLCPFKIRRSLVSQMESARILTVQSRNLNTL